MFRRNGMLVKLDNEAVEAIEAILKRGNNAIVRRAKDGVVILEQTVKTTYRTDQRNGQ